MPRRLTSARVAARHVLIEPGSRAQPEVAVLDGAEPPGEYELPQARGSIQALRGEGRQRHELGFTRELRNEEPAQRPTDRLRDDLRQRGRVAAVCCLEGLKVSLPLGREDDSWRVAFLDQHEIENQTTDASVSVDEWRDSLEPRVMRGGVDHWMYVPAFLGGGAPCVQIGGDGRGEVTRLRSAPAPVHASKRPATLCWPEARPATRARSLLYGPPTPRSRGPLCNPGRFCTPSRLRERSLRPRGSPSAMQATSGVAPQDFRLERGSSYCLRWPSSYEGHLSRFDEDSGPPRQLAAVRRGGRRGA